MVLCKVCASACEGRFELLLQRRYHATLYRCPECLFEFVDDPTWLQKSFDHRLNSMDVGSVDRSLLVAQFLLGLTMACRSKSWKILDVGGGDGLLVRYLRDRGTDARFTDPFSVPVYDVGPMIKSSDQFELGVMSEVALHLADPVNSFRSVLNHCERLLFTAVIPPDPLPRDWWYLMPNTGQHVSFYRVSTIERIAFELGCHWCSDGKFFHYISRKPIPPLVHFLFKRRELVFLLAWFSQLLELAARARGRRVSFTAQDQRRIELEIESGQGF